MTKREVLELLRDLVSDAICINSDPDDWSGIHTQYLVDQEKFLENIETEISKITDEISDLADGE